MVGNLGMRWSPRCKNAALAKWSVLYTSWILLTALLVPLLLFAALCLETYLIGSHNKWGPRSSHEHRQLIKKTPRDGCSWQGFPHRLHSLIRSFWGPGGCPMLWNLHKHSIELVRPSLFPYFISIDKNNQYFRRINQHIVFHNLSDKLCFFVENGQETVGELARVVQFMPP